MKPQLLLLQKTLVVVEGLCRDLAPQGDMWATARTFLRGWLPGAIGPAAQAREGAEEIVSTVRRLPGLIEAAERAGAAFTPEGLRLIPPESSGSFGKSRARNPLRITRCSAGVSGLSMSRNSRIAAMRLPY